VQKQGRALSQSDTLQERVFRNSVTTRQSSPEQSVGTENRISFFPFQNLLEFNYGKQGSVGVDAVAYPKSCKDNDLQEPPASAI